MSELADFEAELPDFEAELAAMPKTAESLAQMLGVAALSAAEAETSPASAECARAAAAQAATLREALAHDRCAPALSGLSASDSARPVLIGTRIETFGRLLCALEIDGPPRHKGPGLFGSRHTVDATVMGGFVVKLVLIEGDAPRGGKALIVTRIENGNGARDVAVAEWQACPRI